MVAESPSASQCRSLRKGTLAAGHISEIQKVSRSTVNKRAQNPSQTKEQSVNLVALVDWQFIKLQKRQPGMSATSRSLLKLDQALNRGDTHVSWTRHDDTLGYNQDTSQYMYLRRFATLRPSRAGYTQDLGIGVSK